MRMSLRLFRWRGITVGMHWSLLIIAVLIAYSLAEVTFPNGAAGYPTIAYWVVAAVVSVAFLIGIAAHEFGHAVTAQRHGIKVSSIDLWLFGGIASLDTQPTSWRAELAVGISGPIVSVLLGSAGVLGSVVIRLVHGSDLLDEALRWFGVSNLALAGFNLLPGAPLDGGRVLSALRWRHHGDVRRARSEAALAGTVVANSMIAVGIVSLFVGWVDTGIWLAFLGWFLGSAARQELASEQSGRLLNGIRVGAVMSAPPVLTSPRTTLRTLVTDVFPVVHGSTIPVVEHGALVGLITPEHVRRVRPDYWGTATVGSVATPASGVATARSEERLGEVLERNGGEVQRFVVLNDSGQVVGVVTPTDIARALQRAALRDLADHPPGR